MFAVNVRGVSIQQLNWDVHLEYSFPVFYVIGCLYRHKHSAHSNTKPYRCPNCGKLFKLNHQLKRHVRIHTDAKPCSCRHCSERFRSSSRYICWSHTMKVLGLLLNFIWQVSHVNSSLQNTFSDMIEAVKPYVCSECPKRFCTAPELRRHHPVHSA